VRHSCGTTLSGARGAGGGAVAGARSPRSNSASQQRRDSLPSIEASLPSLDNENSGH